MNDQNQLLTIGDVAQLLNVHPETLRRWDRSNRLPAVKINARGDRKYRLSDVLRFKAQYTPIPYRGYQIIPYSHGFDMLPDRFALIAKYIVKNDNLIAGFAFIVGGLARFAETDQTDVNLEQLAINTIKQYIDQSKIKTKEEYTFKYVDASQGFIEDENPDWWLKQ